MDDAQGRNIWDLLGDVKTESKGDVTSKSPSKTNCIVTPSPTPVIVNEDKDEGRKGRRRRARKIQRARRAPPQMPRGKQKQLSLKGAAAPSTTLPPLALSNLKKKFTLPRKGGDKVDTTRSSEASPLSSTTRVQSTTCKVANGKGTTASGSVSPPISSGSKPFGADLLRRARGLLKNITPPQNSRLSSVASRDESDVFSISSSGTTTPIIDGQSENVAALDTSRLTEAIQSILPINGGGDANHNVVSGHKNSSTSEMAHALFTNTDVEVTEVTHFSIGDNLFVKEKSSKVEVKDDAMDSSKCQSNSNACKEKGHSLHNETCQINQVSVEQFQPPPPLKCPPFSKTKSQVKNNRYVDKEHCLSSSVQSTVLLDERTGRFELKHSKLKQNMLRSHSKVNCVETVRSTHGTTASSQISPSRPLDLTKHTKLTSPLTLKQRTQPTPLSPSEIPLDLSMKRGLPEKENDGVQKELASGIVGVINVPCVQIVQDNISEHTSRRVILGNQDQHIRKVSPVRPYIRGRPVSKKTATATVLPKPRVTVRGVNVVQPVSICGDQSSGMVSILPKPWASITTTKTNSNTTSGYMHVVAPTSTSALSPQTSNKSPLCVWIPKHKPNEPLTAHVKPLGGKEANGDNDAPVIDSPPAMHSESSPVIVQSPPCIRPMPTFHNDGNVNATSTPVMSVQQTPESVSPPKLTVITPPNAPKKTTDDHLHSPKMPVLSPLPQTQDPFVSGKNVNHVDVQAVGSSPVFDSGGSPPLKHKVILIRRTSGTGVEVRNSTCREVITKDVMHLANAVHGLPEKKVERLKQMGITYHGPRMPEKTVPSSTTPTTTIQSAISNMNCHSYSFIPRSEAYPETIMLTPRLPSVTSSTTSTVSSYIMTAQAKSPSITATVSSSGIHSYSAGKYEVEQGQPPVVSVLESPPRIIAATSLLSEAVDGKCSTKHEKISSAPMLISLSSTKESPSTYSILRKSPNVVNVDSVQRTLLPNGTHGKDVTSISQTPVGGAITIPSVKLGMSVARQQRRATLGAFKPTTKESKQIFSKPNKKFYSLAAFKYTPRKTKATKITDTKYYTSRTVSKSTIAPIVKSHISNNSKMVEFSKKPIPSLDILAAITEKFFVDWKEEHQFFKSQICKTPARLISVPKPKKDFHLLDNWHDLLIEEARKFDEGSHVPAAHHDAITPTTVNAEAEHELKRKRRKRCPITGELLSLSESQAFEVKRRRKKPNLKEAPSVSASANQDTNAMSSPAPAPVWGVRSSTESNGMTLLLSKVKSEPEDTDCDAALRMATQPYVLNELDTCSQLAGIASQTGVCSPNMTHSPLRDPKLSKKRRGRRRTFGDSTTDLTKHIDIVVKEEVSDFCTRTSKPAYSSQGISSSYPFGVVKVGTRISDEMQTIAYSGMSSSNESPEKEGKKRQSKSPHKHYVPSTATGRILTNKKPCCIMHDVELDETENMDDGPIIHPDHTSEDIAELLRQDSVSRMLSLSNVQPNHHVSRAKLNLSVTSEQSNNPTTVHEEKFTFSAPLQNKFHHNSSLENEYNHNASDEKDASHKNDESHDNEFHLSAPHQSVLNSHENDSGQQEFNPNDSEDRGRSPPLDSTDCRLSLDSTKDISLDSSDQPKEKSGKTTQQRRPNKLLKQLANTDGYIAMEMHESSSSTLYADPSTLSREERKLQRALMLMEEEMTSQPQTKVNSPASRKAKQLMKKAVTTSRRTGDVWQSRMQSYHKDNAYENELEKDEGRKRKKKKVPTATLR